MTHTTLPRNPSQTETKFNSSKEAEHTLDKVYDIATFPWAGDRFRSLYPAQA